MIFFLPVFAIVCLGQDPIRFNSRDCPLQTFQVMDVDVAIAFVVGTVIAPSPFQ